MDEPLCVALDPLRHLVEDVGRLMDPTSLLSCFRELFSERSPEAESSVADGKVGCRSETAAFQVTKHGLPGILALTVAVPDSDESLLAITCRAHEHKDAGAVVVESDIEVQPVRPHIDVAMLG